MSPSASDESRRAPSDEPDPETAHEPRREPNHGSNQAPNHAPNHKPSLGELTAADRAEFATKFGGRLLLAGSALTVVLAVSLQFTGAKITFGHQVVIYAVCAVAAVTGLVFVSLRHAAPKQVLYTTPSLAAMLICIPMAAAGTSTPTGVLLLVWPVLFSGYLLPEAVAWWTLASVIVSYTVAVVVGDVESGLAAWVELTASTMLTVMVVISLRRRADRLEAELADQARTDHLTGLDNRRAYSEAMNRELLRHRRSGRPMSLLAVDVDHFKRVNDTWGHAAGDDTLRSLGDLLSSHVRGSDTVGRVGGEEFGVIMPDCASRQARRRAQSLLVAIRSESKTWTHPITVSIGVATLPENASTGVELLAAADSALYEAKAAGRDQVRSAAVVAVGTAATVDEP